MNFNEMYFQSSDACRSYQRAWNSKCLFMARSKQHQTMKVLTTSYTSWKDQEDDVGQRAETEEVYCWSYQLLAYCFLWLLIMHGDKHLLQP